MKTFLAFVICIATCGYAAYRGLQWLAMVVLFGALCVLYKQRLSRAFATALDLLKNTQKLSSERWKYARRSALRSLPFVLTVLPCG
jgi:hypothetical protein